MYKHLYYSATNDTEHKAIICIYCEEYDHKKALQEFGNAIYASYIWLSTQRIEGFDVLA